MKMSIITITALLLISGLSTLALNYGAEELMDRNIDDETIEIPEISSDGFFTENLGQWNDLILFSSETTFGRVGFGVDSIYFDMREVITPDGSIPDLERGLDPTLDPTILITDDFSKDVEVEGHVLKYTFKGTNDILPTGVNPRVQLNNYFLGNDPDRWVSGARNFESIVYENLYDDIDLKYYFSEKQIKYDLVLKPYADPDNIRIEIDGHKDLNIENKNLKIRLTAEKSLQDRDLITYDATDLSTIPSNFKLIGKDTYGFELGPYDNSKTIVIDPMIFSTYLGGANGEGFSGLEEDSVGDVVILGSTWSSDFPVTTGAYEEDLLGTSDIFVAKMQSDGTDLLWATFLGGTGPTESGMKLMVDDNDDIFIVGRTYSSDFPITGGAFDDTMNGTGDIFISKLKSDGSDLLGSTYIGGDGTDSITTGDGFDLTSDGNPVISVFVGTASPNFPTTSGAYDTTLGGSMDIVVFEMEGDCTDLVFSTYIGGAGTEGIRFLEIGPNGEIWIGGYTSSTDFPVSTDAIDGTNGGATDIFLLTLKEDGSDFIYSTYIGGSGADTPYAMKIDEDGYVYMTGITSSSDFPKTVGQSMLGSGDFFVVKIKNDLSGIVYGRLIGGTGFETGLMSMEITDDGEAVVSGETGSTDFPTTTGAFDTTYNGGTYDRVVFKISQDGSSIIGSTYFGGPGLDYGVVKVGPNGEIYLGGPSNNSNVPTTDDADYKTLNGGDDLIFVEFNEYLTDLEYASYYGGTLSESGFIYMNKNTWNIYLAGFTSSVDFPTTDDAYSDTNKGYNDIVIVKVLGGSFGEPLEVYSVKSYSDPLYQTRKTSFDTGEMVFIELMGLDSDVNKSNGARVNVSFGFSPLDLFKLTLKETGNDTGIYRGGFVIPPGTIYCDTLTVYSRTDPTKFQKLFIEPPFRPTSVSSLEVYSDQACTNSVEYLDKGDTGYVEIIGSDANPAMVNKALANLTSESNSSFKIPFVLNETGANTGIYHGSFVLPSTIDYFENYTILSVRNEAIIDKIMIHTPVQIRPLIDVTTAIEDVEYRSRYWNFGYNPETWTMTTSADWLEWDENTNELYGTPDNSEVGQWDVMLEIEDEYGNSDSHEFKITVENTPPDIITENLEFATEGEEYYVDYNSSDDLQGEITWSVIPDNIWLSIDSNSGVLSGIPFKDDVGKVNVTVIVNDGREGTNSTTFLLTVIEVNQPPRITSLDIKTGKQGDRYYRDYEVFDTGGETEFIWELSTNCSFLTLDNETGVLEGTPGPFDVGTWWVNITVFDPEGLFDSHEFELFIENIGDKPIWDDIPENIELLHGTRFEFDVNATDPDPEDVIDFTLWTNPETDMVINMRTGLIEWDVNYLILDEGQDEMEVTIKASDGTMYATYIFTIKIIPTESPQSFGLSPINGEKTSSKSTELSWQGSDPENEIISYTIYIHESQAFVEGRRDEAIFVEDHPENSINVTNLEPGKTYFWTVIPFDQCTYGTCSDGVGSFKLNHPPVVTEIQNQIIKAGKELNYMVRATDADTEDSGSFIFSIEEGPEGMEIGEDTGRIKWRPEDDQVGSHRIIVGIWDGTEKTIVSFFIEVEEGEEDSSSMTFIIIIAVIVIVVILVIIAILFLLKKNRNKGEKEEKEEDDEMEKESLQIQKEMEARKKDKEWEEEHMREKESEELISSVPLSASDAHGDDKTRMYDQPDYVELYGQEAPEIEDGDITKEELKDFIKESIDEIEKISIQEDENIDQDMPENN